MEYIACGFVRSSYDEVEGGLDAGEEGESYRYRQVRVQAREGRSFLIRSTKTGWLKNVSSRFTIREKEERTLEVEGRVSVGISISESCH